MKKLLIIDFPFAGPFGNDLANKLDVLAQKIKDEPGFIWKVWTEDPEAKRSGGVYLFESEESCLVYLHKHLERLSTIVEKEEVKYYLRDLNDDLNKISFIS
ncbi:YdhR family protein [Lentisphaera profundi]|uniref:YdhR family protein n=1 Tax=Lentisphaera profundi TaxID=1658616 RepID=A0ABY7VTS6_9BACT|nr:YdhR family protein [Lentisphaera profundi]WDE96668.1 YdhR family protein [Lentisphaera profundi]